MARGDPQEVQDDLDLLADEALKAAEHLLERHREFLPFAVSLKADGAVTLVGAEPGEDTSSQAMLELLQRGLLDQRETLRAAALVTMVEKGGTPSARRSSTATAARRSRSSRPTRSSACAGPSPTERSRPRPVSASSGPDRQSSGLSHNSTEPIAVRSSSVNTPSTRISSTSATLT